MSARRWKGAGKLHGPPDATGWVWLTVELIGSPTFGALGVSARRILDFLLLEHAGEGGRENGRLAAPYRQLHVFGLTRADIAKGFAELIACGFVRLVTQGLRQAGGGEPSRYALTWLWTLDGSPQAEPPTDDWRRVLIDLRAHRVTTAREVRAWLKRELSCRPRRGRRADTARNIEGAPHMRAEGRLQMRAENKGNVVPLAPQVRGEVGCR